MMPSPTEHGSGRKKLGHTVLFGSTVNTTGKVNDRPNVPDQICQPLTSIRDVRKEKKLKIPG